MLPYYQYHKNKLDLEIAKKRREAQRLANIAYNHGLWESVKWNPFKWHVFLLFKRPEQ